MLRVELSLSKAHIFILAAKLKYISCQLSSNIYLPSQAQLFIFSSNLKYLSRQPSSHNSPVIRNLASLLVMEAYLAHLGQDSGEWKGSGDLLIPCDNSSDNPPFPWWASLEEAWKVVVHVMTGRPVCTHTVSKLSGS